MTIAVLLLLTGVLLSAFFSGAETGLYRVTRVRLVIRALAGDYVSRGLLWLTNHPSMFVATTLVGNNLANYLVSLAIVIGTSRLLPGGGQTAELVAPILLAPILFVLGESVPKTLFYTAPNRILRRCGLPVLISAILFLPVTAILWVVSRTLELIVGQSPQKLQLVLARRELEQVFQEGHEAGLLNPAQQAIAQGLFALADRPVHHFVIPAAKMASVTNSMSKQDILRVARRHRVAVLPVEDVGNRRRVMGYLRVVDLYLNEGTKVPPPLPVVTLRAEEPVLKALSQLQHSAESLGHVVDADGRTIGFVTPRHLTKALFRDR